MQLPIGLSQISPCPYLPEQKEQLCFTLCNSQQKTDYYPQLLALGFRRSGNELYRPACEHCHACQSLRVDTQAFSASRSQKRILNKNKLVTMQWEEELNQVDYQLFERYIAARHQDGSMYPASEESFFQFLSCEWSNTRYLKLFLNDQLIAVCVTDVQENAYSAVYTFFEPNLAQLSLGNLAVLMQISAAQQNNKSWLYLGYQVDNCKKMNYKRNYLPHQRFINGKWQ
ncbi:MULTISPECIES: arginyltransferase [unclassified Agarivorans]|uniref:arginyltransferase n=1 Tax=unclassified Agarivorans TaxID=2636026 RepID=UPI0026E369AB|nr:MULTISPECIES: arginyltransferase [unclassified Agarivorans]MDO6684981.1 arginyltransferase [Agarivorans sp. 3_MG-2023]MDO6714858.1 arginyltransferase [Agarivorans sp. 2_MG-2023]